MAYCLPKNKENGFTLVELLIAMTIGLIILAALSSTFLMQRKIYDVQEQIVEMVQTARAAMDMMTREIRMAGYDPARAMQSSDPTEKDFVGIPYDATNALWIYADMNGDGNIFDDDSSSADPNERIRYTFDQDHPFSIRRGTGGSFGGTPSRQPFAENIHDFTFDYLDSNGIATTITDNIRQIRITITARTSKADADYTHPTENDHYRRHTLKSLITPRNLGL